MVGLGLSARNIRLLMEGKPIYIRLSDLNPNMRGDILVMYGVTEDAMADALKGWIGPETVVRHDQDPNTEHER